MIFQQVSLLHNLTVFDNVAFPLRLHGMLNPPRLRQRVLDCLERVGLAARADDYPARLSADQVQRVALARALGSQPEVLLCDEPPSALLGIVRSVHSELGVTIVIVSHDLPMLGALCDRVAILENGVVAETFDPADTTAPRVTALGRELAFHGAETAALFRPGALHA
jgi:D-methionine transport system ATP-binding protein